MPAVDIMGGKCVRLIRGAPHLRREYYEDPVKAAKLWEAEGAEWIHVVDLDRAMGIGDNRDKVYAILEGVDCKVQVGGGIRSLEAAGEMFERGASRVVIGTRAVRDPDFLRSLGRAFGDERIAAAVDVRGGSIAIEGWREVTELDPLRFAGSLKGAGFLVLTLADYDGTLKTPALGLVEDVKRIARIPLIVGGGISDIEGLRALARIGVWGAIIGRALYEGALDFNAAVEAVADVD
ncbi:MAG: 1-(5-phosphoribosyl)-5-[(5-phosphoribosylamino)methylideneamino] imidazole-4-carboxamide isomerase [Candidatus Bathyarchaeia archaeon]